MNSINPDFRLGPKGPAARYAKDERIAARPPRDGLTGSSASLGTAPAGGFCGDPPPAQASFLVHPDVPTAEWRQLTAGQRDLHTFWVKKFLPLFDDYERIRRADLPDDERHIVREMLDLLAWKRLSFSSHLTHQSTAGTTVDILRARTHINAARMTIRVTITRPAKGGSDPAPQISFRAQGSDSDIEALLQWRPQEDPRRGSVFLYPQAMTGSHHFPIAAFNAQQFDDMALALLAYLRPD